MIGGRIPLWVCLDLRCWHWPSFSRDLRDGDGNICPGVWEFLLGPLHAYWIHWHFGSSTSDGPKVP